MNDPLDDFAIDPVGLSAALEALIRHRSQPGLPHPEPIELPGSWPDEGLGGSGALDLLADAALAAPARLDHVGFLAHMDPPTPWFTWAAAQWAAANNQNLLHPDVAPQMRALERTVIDWIAPTFGMSGGHLVPGSTVANLTALWAARDLRNVDEIVSSSAAHLSVAKAAHLLGLRHRVVPVTTDQRLDLDALGDLRSAALVLTAGTVAAGAVDSFTAAERDPAWLHVDAAWAGPLAFSERHAPVLAGIESADSVGFSAHKWLHQPKDCGVVLFADVERAHAALSFGGSYLSAPNVGLLGSSGARALPLATTLLAWGRSGVAQVVDAGMSRIDELATAIDASPSFIAFGRNRSGVLLWRPVDPDIDLRAVQAELDDAWVSLAQIDAKLWFRSVGANPLAQPNHVIDRVSAAIDAVRGP